MSVLMSWNIERFGQNKLVANQFFDPTSLREPNIVSTITQSGADLFAVIEVQTGAGGGFGSLITPPSGVGGVISLLLNLRANVDPNWQVVPPLILTPNGGYSEGIAIFFNSNTFQFCGPLAWTGAGTGPIAAGGGGGVPYPTPPWGIALPIAPNILNNTAQNTLAGQCQFQNAGAPVFFNNNNCRSIWWTQFLDISANPNRLLNLFTVHFPPFANQAALAFAQLANVPQITGPLAANEDRIVWGDFNINALNPAAAAVFAHLTGGPVPYTALINLPTNLRDVRRAATTGVAPYYHYVKGSNAGGYINLDNIFVARQNPPPGAVNRNIANRTFGGGGFTVDMVRPLFSYFVPPGTPGYMPPGGARARAFRNPVNFGHIGGKRGVSDHMAVVVTLP